MHAARRGDERAFEGLFRAYQGAIYALVLHFVGDPELAADLTQDVFVRAWEKLGRLDESAPIVAETEEPPEQAATHERERAVRAAVLELPEHQRTVVVMHHLEGKRVDDVAAELGLPKGTVVSRLARGREAMRRKLARFVDEEG